MSQGKSDIRLLMVDDETEFLQAMEPGLARRGFDVATAEDGSKALELIRSHTFDVILLDVKMPGIDGVEVFRAVKREAPEIPVVLLTGHGNLQQAFETSREGVDEYLTKPCDVETLAGVLKAAVARGAAVERSEGVGAEDTPRSIDVLLVDDDEEFLRSVSPALERRGMRVATAHSASEALRRVGESPPQVAVVDVVMPGLDGLELLQRLRAGDPFLQVIILTGKPRVGDVRKGLMEGAFDYLIKPSRVEDLARVIRSAWELRAGQEEEARRADVERILSDRPD